MLHSGNAQPPTTNSHLFPRPWLEFENFDGVYSFLLCVSWGTYVILRPPLLKTNLRAWHFPCIVDGDALRCETKI